MKISKRTDRIAAIVFMILSAAVIAAMAANPSFFQWAFERHHNQLSWYIRPLFLIPFCFFAYKKSLSGISLTIFLLITSMFWFSAPAESSEMVKEFLAMEMDYLSGEWTLLKIMLSFIVPISLGLLAYAFWRRSIWFGISVMAFIAVAKMIWSAVFGGESGQSIIVPAVAGLTLCIAFVIFAFRKTKKASKKE